MKRDCFHSAFPWVTSLLRGSIGWVCSCWVFQWTCREDCRSIKTPDGWNWAYCIHCMCKDSWIFCTPPLCWECLKHCCQHNRIRLFLVDKDLIHFHQPLSLLLGSFSLSCMCVSFYRFFPAYYLGYMRAEFLLFPVLVTFPGGLTPLTQGRLCPLDNWISK